jgi:hypothetical protein
MHKDILKIMNEIKSESKNAKIDNLYIKNNLYINNKVKIDSSQFIRDITEILLASKRNK